MKRDTLTIFQGKRVLITGHTGFKGAWLGLWLSELGAEVVGYALPPETDSLFNRLGLAQLIRHIEGDVRDLERLQALYHEFQPEVLFHLAAQALVRLSYQEPKLTFDTNVGGAVNVLEASRRSEALRTIIFVTSDKCYRNREWIWGYRENDELGGNDPYSASKAAAEMVFQAYVHSFFQKRRNLGVASVRAGNILGGGDWAQDRLVPDVIKALVQDKPIILRNPDATRPWQHVLDPLGAYLLLAARLYEDPQAFSGSWNFGPSGEGIRSVGDVAEKIITLWGKGTIRVERQTDAPSEAGLLHLCCDKAKRALNWSPKWDFERTVEETVLWYKRVMSGASALELTKGQLQAYMEENHD